MYGKFENGHLVVAPNDIIIDDKRIINPDDETLISLGWLPVVVTEEPVVEEGFKAVISHYEEQDGQLVSIWAITELSEVELSISERIAILEEELTATKILLGVE